MKRIAAAFTALFVLASCLMAGGSIYMHAHRNDLEITGEVLYGERAMASGVEVRQSVLIDGHPNWEVSYSPAAASHVTRADWSLPELRRTAAQPPAISIGSMTSGLTISYDSGRSVVWLYDIPVVQEIADGIAASAAGGGEYATELLLNDYTDCLPIVARVDSDIDIGREEAAAGIDLSDVFPLPMPYDLPCRVTYSSTDASGSMGTAEFRLLEYPYDIDGSSVLAADGNLYLAFTAHGADGDLLDGSSLPGGSWGVWRIPCEVTGSDSGERWWAGRVRLSADLDAVELVSPIGTGVDAVKLCLSYDGTKLLLLTAESGTLYLTVIDTATGENLQRLALAQEEELCPDGGLAQAVQRFVQYSSAGSEVLLTEGRALVLAGQGGEYSLAMSADLTALPVPECYSEDAGGSTYLWDYGAMVSDGKRLLVLEHVGAQDAASGTDGDGTVAERLSVFGPGGLEYCEWLESQLHYYYYGSPEHSFSVDFTAGFAA